MINTTKRFEILIVLGIMLLFTLAQLAYFKYGKWI